MSLYRLESATVLVALKFTSTLLLGDNFKKPQSSSVWVSCSFYGFPLYFSRVFVRRLLCYQRIEFGVELACFEFRQSRELITCV